MAKKEEETKPREEEQEAGGVGSAAVFIGALVIGVGFFAKQRGLLGFDKAINSKCGCDKVWEPICVQTRNEYPDAMPAEARANMPAFNSQTMPNKCEAECLYYGPEYAKQYEGECMFPAPKPVELNLETCLYQNCTQSEGDSSVCLLGQMFPDRCFLGCVAQTSPDMPFDVSRAVEGKCEDACDDVECGEGRQCQPSGGACFDGSEDCKLYKCVSEDCNCDPKEDEEMADFFKPVCAQGRSFTTACYAECEGATDYTEGECKVKDAFRAMNGVFPYPDSDDADEKRFQQQVEAEKQKKVEERHLKLFEAMPEPPKKRPVSKKQGPPGGPPGMGQGPPGGPPGMGQGFPGGPPGMGGPGGPGGPPPK